MIVQIKKCKNLCQLILKKDCFLPLRVKETAKDFLGFKNSNKDRRASLNKAMKWLSLAQDATLCNGISSHFSFFDGWARAYPEVSGYVISTFVNYARLKNKPEYLERAERIADWECSIANTDGSIRGGLAGARKKPSLFNTAQVVLGMCDIYSETKRESYLGFIKRSSSWLKNTITDRVPTYNTRTCWALLKSYQILGEESLKETAIKMLDSYLSRQKENGWYANNSFKDENPYLHTIAYAIRGFLESGIILECERYVNSSGKAAGILLDIQEKGGVLLGQYDKMWKPGFIDDFYCPTSHYRCLTGEAQMSIIWTKLYIVTKNERYKNAAKKINRELMKTQIFNRHDERVDGAVKGSYPIYGSYMRFRIPSWAVKFFADALIMEEEYL